MYNTKNLIGLPVLSLYEGELVGNISNVFFDKKLRKVMFFQVEDQDIKYSLATKNIYKIGKNAITIKNNACLTLQLDNDIVATIPAPYESKTYTIQGEFLGKIDQITFNEKYIVDTILLDNQKVLDCSNLASCSKNTILVYDQSTHINVSKFKNRALPKLFRTKNTQKVTTQPQNDKDFNIEPSTDNQLDLADGLPTVEEKNFEIHNISLPTAITNYPTFLIGRVVVQDIMLDDKKSLIKANSTITDRTLTLALANNKIRELMLFSRQK